MNTFLPSDNYLTCGRVLDPARLSAQISCCVTVAKLLNAYEKICFNGKLPFGVRFPPVIRLWISQDNQLLVPELRQYQYILNSVWAEIRGSTHASIMHFNWGNVGGFRRAPYRLSWPDSVYRSHRSKLLTKDFGYYRTSFEREQLPLEEAGEALVWEHPTILK
jgi:hypothetical protein